MPEDCTWEQHVPGAWLFTISIEYQVKSLESQFAGLPFEIGTSSVRLFVAYYKGLPFDLTDDIYLPLEAVEILKKAGNLTSDQTAYMNAHAVSLDQAGAIPVLSTQPPTNLTMPDASTEVKDYFNVHGEEFSTYKAGLQALVDQVK